MLDKRSIWYLARDENCLADVKKAWAAGIDINKKDSREWTPLHYAAQNGCTEIVRFLLSKGANVNVQADHKLTTPLHCAVDGEPTFEIVKLLLTKGANPLLEDNNGCTALSDAGASSRSATAKLLRTVIKDPNQRPTLESVGLAPAKKKPTKPKKQNTHTAQPALGKHTATLVDQRAGTLSNPDDLGI